MAKRMLIDATHPEETRVVVLNGNRIDEFDFESSTKKQVKGNIYLAKVIRVEPSLQAAFVDYGGNRHGFLAFSEIHPDYYRIPIADREPGDGETGPEDADARGSAPEDDDGAASLATALPEPVAVAGAPAAEEESADADPWEQPGTAAEDGPAAPPLTGGEGPEAVPLTQPWGDAAPLFERGSTAAEPDMGMAPAHRGGPEGALYDSEPDGAAIEVLPYRADPFPAADEAFAPAETPAPGNGEDGEAEIIETLGGDEFEEAETQRSRTFRHYKIQEVVKRRQIMLIQVTKEERGNKGAALTTYLSLAGRYCVLMPNTARGGGVSRKITSLSDRRRLKDILEELDIPEGMGVIVRTAGAERSKAEIRRDYEYLLRLWNEIRDLTLQSTAPALIYEEGNLIKRSIRDLYTRDIDEVLVEGEDGYRTAKAFMKMLMPSHAKRVQPYRDPQIGLLHRFQVESQLDAIHSPIVQLRSGGYVVINQTEALVAIDVNSGRSTRERNIEETALRTNLEAAEELARQLRLRDLAGLIVIDFIDMEERRNQGAVERRLKDALKNDRARIQVGRISAFGLLEMSRQRLRPSLVETSTQPCPHCGGTGFIRSTESAALYVLRSIEEEGIRRRSAEICVYVPTTVALYILNQKRESLAQIEARCAIHVLVARDDALIPPAFRLERLRAYGPGEASAPLPAPLTQAPAVDEDEDEEAEEEKAEAAERVEAERREPAAEEERGRARRRRRRRRRPEEAPAGQPAAPAPAERAEEEHEPIAAGSEPRDGAREADAEQQPRHRGRRGGRRRGRREAAAETGFDGAHPSTAAIEILPTAGVDEEEPAIAATEAGWPSAISAEIPIAAAEAVGVPALSGNGEMAATANESGPFAAGNGTGAPQPEPVEGARSAEPAGPPEMPPAAEAEAAPPVLVETAPMSWTAPPLPEPSSAGPALREPAVEVRGVAPSMPPSAEPAAAGPLPVETVPPWQAAPSSPPAASAADRPAPAPAEPESAPEAIVETEAAAPLAAEPQPAHPVQTVSEKPADPRKGWWQRLMQS